MTTYQELQQAVIHHLAEGDPEEVLLTSESGQWTRQQLIEAVRNQRYEGIRLVNNLMKLSLDLVLRGKEKLAGFEVVNRSAEASQPVILVEEVNLK